MSKSWAGLVAGVWAEMKKQRKAHLWLSRALTLVSVLMPDRSYLGHAEQPQEGPWGPQTTCKTRAQQHFPGEGPEVSPASQRI